MQSWLVGLDRDLKKTTFTETKITLISLNTQLTVVQKQSKLHCSRLKESLQLVHNFNAHKYIWQIYDKKMATQKWPKNWKMTFLHSHIIAWQCSNMVFLTRKQIQVSQYTVSLILRSLKPNTYVFIIWSHDYTGVLFLKVIVSSCSVSEWMENVESG